MGPDCCREASQDGSGPRTSVTKTSTSFYSVQTWLLHMQHKGHNIYGKTFERVKKNNTLA